MQQFTFISDGTEIFTLPNGKTCPRAEVVARPRGDPAHRHSQREITPRRKILRKIKGKADRCETLCGHYLDEKILVLTTRRIFPHFSDELYTCALEGGGVGGSRSVIFNKLLWYETSAVMYFMFNARRKVKIRKIRLDVM